MLYRTKCDGMTDRLRNAVLDSGLTAHEIRGRMGIPKSTYYNHMNGGGLTALWIARYCAVLGCSADWLLGLKP